jgi:hypothetical protein
VDLDKLINQVSFKELEEKYKISFMKVNLKTMFLMDGADILIIKEFIGDFGRTDLEMDVENGYQQMEKSRKETGLWVL